MTGLFGILVCFSPFLIIIAFEWWAGSRGYGTYTIVDNFDECHRTVMNNKRPSKSDD